MGNIPYYNENLSFPYICDQMQADQVYQSVITTLEEALAAINVSLMKARVGEEGRITRAMAYMLYTEMVLYQNDESRFGKALLYMKEIIDSKQYSWWVTLKASGRKR